jgi:hypothetical protein
MRSTENVCGARLRRRRILAHALLGASLLLCAALLLDPPSQTSLYPLCPIHRYLGILCPGCGATRALAALLRGHLAAAWRLNALFVLLLPAGVVGAVESYRRALRSETFCWPQPPPAALYATITAAAVFAVVRNLP